MSRRFLNDGFVRRRGFTLVETIASLVVLSMTIPPIMIVMQRASTDQLTPIMTSRARWLATEKIEDIIADRHSATRGYDYLITANYVDETPITSDPGFSRTVSLSVTAADLVTAGTGYMTVTVAVSWADSTGSARQIDIVTVLTEYDP